jgi:hypothetical protein
MAPINFDAFKDITFESFRKRALDESLNRHEKVGFPTSYREGKESRIFEDIVSKLTNLNKKNRVVMDIGPGCSGIPFMLIELCRKNGHSLILVDSDEMLSHLPDEPFITKVQGYYPGQCGELFEKHAKGIDAILAYSMFPCVFVESNPFDFIDKSLGLLADNGEMLIGDIANISKKKRFLSSANGIRFHQELMETEEVPTVEFNTLEFGKVDDAVMLSLLLRCRSFGFDAYLLPQPDDLPLANRREDILIKKP